MLLNYFQLPMKFIKVLIVAQREILRGSFGIEGNLLRLLKNYLTTHQQRVVLNGQTSSWLNITAGDPQGSVL